jgi:hypothetical protein
MKEPKVREQENYADEQQPDSRVDPPIVMAIASAVIGIGILVIV